MAKAKSKLQYYEAIGRRKSSVARVRLYVPGKDKSALVDGIKANQGDALINKKSIDTVFSSVAEKVQYLQPLKLVDSESRFVISAHVRGGGRSGQLDAYVLGLTRALEKVDSQTYRPLFKKEGLLTRDARVRERRKVGTGGKARRAKQSPKR